jgi:hypothetical protein
LLAYKSRRYKQVFMRSTVALLSFSIVALFFMESINVTAIKASPLPTSSSENLSITRTFESGTLDGFRCSGNCPDIVSTHAREGTKSLRSTVKRYESETPYRTELILETDSGSTNMATPNTDYWYGWSIYLPTTHSATEVHEIVAQFHALRDSELAEEPRNPPLLFATRRGHWIIESRFDSNQFTQKGPDGKFIYSGFKRWDIGEYETGVWTDFVAHIKWTHENDDGIIEIWMNGEKIIEAHGPNTYNDKLYPYFKMGLYIPAFRCEQGDICAPDSTESVRTVYHDEFRTAKSTGNLFPLVSPKGAHKEITSNTTDNIADTIVTKGLVAHYTFDEGAGRIAKDRIGKNHGTLSDGPQWTTDAAVGLYSIAFNGLVRDKITILQNPAINALSETLSISFWLKGNPSQQTEWANLIDKFAGTVGWQIHLENTGPDVELRLDTTEGARQKPADIDKVLDNTWHHLVWTIDYETIHAYKDGIFLKKVTYKKGEGLSNNTNLCFGDNCGTGSQEFAGMLDDVRLYNRVLLPEEIYLLAHKSTSKTTVPNTDYINAKIITDQIPPEENETNETRAEYIPSPQSIDEPPRQDRQEQATITLEESRQSSFSEFVSMKIYKVYSSLKHSIINLFNLF